MKKRSYTKVEEWKCKTDPSIYKCSVSEGRCMIALARSFHGHIDELDGRRPYGYQNLWNVLSLGAFWTLCIRFLY